MEALLKKHADVNMQGKVIYFNLSLSKVKVFLLAHLINYNFGKLQDRKTALYWSVEKSHIPVVKLILSCQPDLEVSTKVFYF